jgi:hypothetical protein
MKNIVFEYPPPIKSYWLSLSSDYADPDMLELGSKAAGSEEDHLVDCGRNGEDDRSGRSSNTSGCANLLLGFEEACAETKMPCIHSSQW